MPNAKKCRPGQHPEGMVLAFTLVILMLMSLMGMAILMNTRTELNISANTALGRDAFTRTDMASRIATFMGRIILNSGAAGGAPLDVLTESEDSPLKVYIKQDFNLGSLEQETFFDDYDVTRRYIRSGSWLEKPESGGSATDPENQPHLTFTELVGNEEVVVANAALALDYGEMKVPGASLGVSDYDNSGGTRLVVVTIISTNGRTPNISAGKAQGTAFHYGGEFTDEPHSIITIIFREVM